MDQRISLITLGVPDMDVAAAFYEALGWRRVPGQEGVIAFDLIEQTLGLYPLENLARDMGLPVGDLGHGAMTLAYNVRAKQEVATLLATAETAGATILKSAHDVFWGGHIGYFRAPDRCIWEVAYNPYAPLAADGAFRWAGYD
ncbi:VOC family protein [Sedimentitalea todarodis]|uniref:VOC family protein n=1 Tax=Sedimentitalea todarodis TaxID=1631240 RepID=A0ABU3VF53_9RHOB|nr:VOC family protein [Sedimentitalea todarodis]MDU9004812.1 VOC family protein [Sedimentitalea todarodis]